jgi:hypothetical protein
LWRGLAMTAEYCPESLAISTTLADFNER